MSAPGSDQPPGERWNVNLPAVIGVVFVFLVGVVVWVLVRDDGAQAPTVAPPSSGTAFVAVTTEPPTTTATTSRVTTPPLMPTSTLVESTSTSSTSPPSTSLPPSSTPPTTALPTTTPATTSPPTTADSPTSPTTPVTASPDAGDDAVAGDLGIAGRPMEQPNCDGSYITILASAVGDQATADGIEQVLETYPTSEYLRTDQTCASLNQDVDGEPIYIVYFGPFAFDSDACTARADGPDDAYARRLTDDPDAAANLVDCP